jgi:hypothetical protein
MTTTTDSSTSNAHEIHEAEYDRVNEITDEIMELGAIWARYGLLVGRSAMDAYARTLATTGRLLGHVLSTRQPGSQVSVTAGAARARP